MARSIEKGNGVRQEIIGIALLALALYSAISLFTRTGPQNWGGTIGHYLSIGLIRSIGYTSYVFPIILLILSIEFILRRYLSLRWAAYISSGALILALSALLAGIAPTEGAGGVVGGFLSRILSGWLGNTGSIIILFAIVLSTALVATGVSFVQLLLKFAPYAYMLIKSLVRPDSVEDVEREMLDETIEAGEKNTVRVEKEASAQAPAIISPQIHKAGRKEGAKKDDTEPEHLEFSSPRGTFKLPGLNLLDPAPEKADAFDDRALLENSKILENKLKDFGIDGRVLEVRPGPVVTMYEFEPAPGVKVGRITGLSDDLALAMKAMSIRIIAPIPGKAVVGIEVPNQKKELIRLKELLESAGFAKNRSRLSLALGKDISGTPHVADLARMPHLLVAGATGTGKSISVNAMILSILFKATPDEVRFLLVDPKMLELSAYEGIPHLMSPVITDPKRAAGALRSIVAEMARRYKLMAEKGAKNIEKYNQLLDKGAGDEAKEDEKKLPYIVVIIDELADLMMTSGKDVEECLVRLSQMARASGIHLLVATQRPSVDVVTGLIKTNFPARIAFQLPSRIDSRTILDSAGAETLLGEGDMLYLPPGTSRLLRIHGVYVSESEIKKVTDFWKKQGSPAYDAAILEDPGSGEEGGEDDLGEEFLKRYSDAVLLAGQMEIISTSYIQRRFRIGYNTAARIIERMEKEGIVGPAQGSRPRQVLKRQ